jgi:hypothetical protein
VRQQHAHSWVEAYLPEVGWITFDPTPLAAAALRPRGLLYKLGQFSDSLEMSWSKYVIEYDLRAQQRLADRLHRVFTFGSGSRPAVGEPLKLPPRRRWLLPLSYAGAGVLFAALVAWALRRQLRRRQPAVQLQLETQGQLRRALQVLRRRGYHQRPGETLQQLAARVEAAGDSAGATFAELVHRYYAHRFGQQAIDLTEVARLTRVMARAPRSSSALPAMLPGSAAEAAAAEQAAAPDKLPEKSILLPPRGPSGVSPRDR